MSLNPQQEKILTAFVTALAQQDESLPSALQKQLNAIGQNLEGRVVELSTIAASLPSLNQAYQVALSDTQTDKGSKAQHSFLRIRIAAPNFTSTLPKFSQIQTRFKPLSETNIEG
jgi:CHASE2 domain-containing sensor protein